MEPGAFADRLRIFREFDYDRAFLMGNHFVDEAPLSSSLSRLRVCDPFYVAAGASDTLHGYRLVCVDNFVGESVLFCFDRVAVLAPPVSLMLERIHRLVAADTHIPADTIWYELCTVHWLKIGPTFSSVSFDGYHLLDCGPWVPLQWVAEQHLIDPKCIESFAGPVMELFTAPDVAELADSRKGEEREQIRRLAGLSSNTAIIHAPCDVTAIEPHVFEPGTFDIDAYIHLLKD
jgi:hypothetical protein